MTTAARLFRVLQVCSLCFLLFAPPAWAQQSYRDAADDSALTAQDFDDEVDDNGQRFEQELSDIERQYSELVPDAAKSTALQDATNAVHDGKNEESEEDE